MRPTLPSAIRRRRDSDSASETSSASAASASSAGSSRRTTRKRESPKGVRFDVWRDEQRVVDRLVDEGGGSSEELWYGEKEMSSFRMRDRVMVKTLNHRIDEGSAAGRPASPREHQEEAEAELLARNESTTGLELLVETPRLDRIARHELAVLAVLATQDRRRPYRRRGLLGLRRRRRRTEGGGAEPEVEIADACRASSAIAERLAVERASADRKFVEDHVRCDCNTLLVGLGQ